MVLFSATWCNPCQNLKRWMVEQDIKTDVVDIDEEPEKSKKFGIRSVPALLLDGKLILGDKIQDKLREVYV